MNQKKPALVVYYSLTGNTERVAKDIAGRLHADVESIHDKRQRRGVVGRFFAAFDAWRMVPAAIGALRFNPSEYEIVLIGTPVWVGQMAPAVRAYLQQESRGFHAVGFFTTSGSTGMASVAAAMQLVAQRAPVAAMGLRAHELADTGIYESKISAFVQDVRNSTVQRADECGCEHTPTHCRLELAADVSGE